MRFNATNFAGSHDNLFNNNGNLSSTIIHLSIKLSLEQHDVNLRATNFSYYWTISSVNYRSKGAMVLEHCQTYSLFASVTISE